MANRWNNSFKPTVVGPLVKIVTGQFKLVRLLPLQRDGAAPNHP